MRDASPARIAGLSVLLLAGAVAGVGTALPWLIAVAILPAPQGRTHQVTHTYAGVDYGNGWFVVAAAGLLAAVAVGAALIRRQWFDWLVLLPVVIGGLALGDWLAALRVGAAGFPAGVALSLAGILLATPAAAILHPARLPGRLAIAAATLVATGVALLLGLLLGTVSLILIYRAF